MPTLSASAPSRYGTTAPPTHALMISPDPLLVIGPRPAMPSVKIFGNMMEFRNPHNTSVQMATSPEENMEMAISVAAAKPKIVTSFPDLTLVRIQEPSKRPTSAPNQ